MNILVRFRLSLILFVVWSEGAFRGYGRNPLDKALLACHHGPDFAICCV